MKPSGIIKSIVILAFGLAIWAACGAVMFAGLALTSLTAAIWIHLAAAPLIAAGVSGLYFSRFSFTSPLAAVALFTSIVILMDVLVVALLIEQSFAMFGSLLGTWIPFTLIFAATYFTGRRTEEASEFTAPVTWPF